MTASIPAQQHQAELEQLKATRKEMTGKLLLRQIQIVDLTHLLSKQQKDSARQKQEWDEVKAQHEKWLAHENELSLAKQREEFEKAKAQGKDLAIVPWYPTGMAGSKRSFAEVGETLGNELLAGTSGALGGNECTAGTSGALGNSDDLLLNVDELLAADDPIGEYMKNLSASGNGKGKC